jgi:hypothetical protein
MPSSVTPVPKVSEPIVTGSLVSSSGTSREYPVVFALATLLDVTCNAPCAASSPLSAVARLAFRLDIGFLQHAGPASMFGFDPADDTSLGSSANSLATVVRDRCARISKPRQMQNSELRLEKLPDITADYVRQCQVMLRHRDRRGHSLARIQNHNRNILGPGCGTATFRRYACTRQGKQCTQRSNKDEMGKMLARTCKQWKTGLCPLKIRPRFQASDRFF